MRLATVQFAITVAVATTAVSHAPFAEASVSIYATLQSPKEHPLYDRRSIKPPERAAFGSNGVGIMALRSFPTTPNGTLFNLTELFDQYTVANDLSSIIWSGQEARC